MLSVLVLAIVINKSFLVIKVEGDSMTPTYVPNQVVMATKLFISLAPGDIVVAIDPIDNSKFIIKRIKYVNGDKVFLVGDNANISLDSRYFGEVEISTICGKILNPRKAGTYQ